MRDGHAVLDWSRAGIVVDGVDLAAGAAIGTRGTVTTTNRDYPIHGVHATAHERSTNASYGGVAKNGTRFSFVVRAFDDGVGFRFLVPGREPRTPDEATTFVLPAGSTTWTHDLHMHYEAVNVKRAIEDVPAGDWEAPPQNYKQPGSAAKASNTETANTK
jgi:alpha-glucosidase